MRFLTREEALRRRANRRRALQLGAGAAGLSLASPFLIRAQGDNTRGQEEDTPTEAPAEVATDEVAQNPPEAATAEATEPAASHTVNENADVAAIGEGLFPNNRVLLYYGFPENPNMGILGEHTPDQLHDLLKEQAAKFEAADSSKPWKIGLELIASVAQGSAQPDNTWVADTDGEFLDQYAEFCETHDMVLFLDVQMGFREPYEDYIGLERWMELPFVHLGIDPEFHMRDEERPGVDIGQVTAAEITEAQLYLRDLSASKGLPRKSLIVHQFHHSMIEEKDQVAAVDGVDLIIDMDGWGPPSMKEETYTVVITNEPIEYNGVKLFYRQDDPIWTEDEVMSLDPVPDLVIYQ